MRAASAEQNKDFCDSAQAKSPRKGSMAQTMKDKVVTGNNVGRTDKVTGNEYGMRQRLKIGRAHV